MCILFYLVFERVPSEEGLAALARQCVEVVPECLVPAHHAQLVILLPLRSLRIVCDILALLHDRSLNGMSVLCAQLLQPLSRLDDVDKGFAGHIVAPIAGLWSHRII